MVFGTNALIVKPAISVAPMFVAAILNVYGYSDLAKKAIHGERLVELHDAMFTLIAVQPIVIGILQYMIWSTYSIRSKSGSQTNLEVISNEKLMDI